MKEVYKPVEGYENLYEVSNTGNVRSLVNRYKNTKGIFLLSQENVRAGNGTYKRVQLSGPRKRFSVHRLVAEAFIKNPRNKPQVNHIDNNPSNNVVTNLEWCTGSENLIHAQKQGRLYDAQSKGGIAAGKIATEKVLAEVEKMLGSKYGYFTVTSIGHYSKTSNIHMVGCTCKCGKEFTINKTALLSGKSTSCLACAGLRKAKRRNEEILSTLTGTTIGTWFITGKTNGLVLAKQLKLEGKCIVCGETTSIPYHKLPKIKKCPLCKNNKVKI